MSERFDLLELDLPGQAPFAPAAPAPAAPAAPVTSGTWRTHGGQPCLALPRGAGSRGLVVTTPTGDRVLAGVVAVEPAGGPEIWSVVPPRAAPAPVTVAAVNPLGLAVEQISTRPAARPAAPAMPVTEQDAARGALRAGELVAGAVAEGHGALVGWHGHGELTRGALAELLTGAGVEVGAWLPPARSAQAHAAAACRALGAAYVVRPTPVPGVPAVDRRGRPTTRPATVEERGWLARWTVGRVTGAGEVGEAYGQISVAVRLDADGTLHTDGWVEGGAAIRAEYDRARAGEVYRAADLTAWLASKLYARGAVRLGSIWYIPTAVRGEVESVVAALAAVWGTAWTAPPIPVATTDQLRDGLVRGLTDEVVAVIADLAALVNEAADAKRPVGERAAATLARRLGECSDRAHGYAALLGDERVATVRREIAGASDRVEPYLSEAAKRGAALEFA